MLYSKGHGYANIERGISVCPKNSIFRVASVSKIFTIIGVMQLAEQGIINLEDDVKKYLQGFTVENNYIEPIRIKYLLTHTDGFETRDLATFARQPKELPTLEDLLKKDLKSPVQEPGSQVTYGGYGTALTGYLISQIKNMNFEDYMEENIFRPLGMENTTFSQILPNNFKGRLVNIYNYDDKKDIFIPSKFLYVQTSPTGALSTTVEDMGKFLITLLNKDRCKENQILNEETIEKMFSSQYRPHKSLPGITYGFMESFNSGQRGLIRDGSGVGIRSQIYLLPEYNLGYFYVQNSGGDKVIDEFNEFFIKHLFPKKDARLDDQIYINELEKFEGNYRPAQTAKHTLVKLEALAIGDLKVSSNDNGELIIKVLGTGGVYGGFTDESKWIQAEPLLFHRTDKEQYIAFQEDKNGKIISLASGSGYHGSFTKIPCYESNRAQLCLLATYIITFIVTIIINLFNIFKAGKNNLRVASTITSILFIISIFGLIYSLFIKRIEGFPAFAFGVPLLSKVMLTILIIASFLSHLFLILFLRGWYLNKLTIFDKLFYSVNMLAFAGIILWLRYWNLLGYKF